MIFKTQHPQSLISRMFILEYMRMLDKDMMYKKANEHQKTKFFYTYETEQVDEVVTMLDLNWEYLLFEASITELEYFMKNFLPELLAIDEKMKAQVERMKAEAIVEQSRQPVDVNLMDVAKADLRPKPGKIII